MRGSLAQKGTRIYLFWGTVLLSDVTLETLTANVSRNEALGNMQIEERYDALDGFIDMILFGLVRPYSVILRADVYEQTDEIPRDLIERLEQGEDK